MVSSNRTSTEHVHHHKFAVVINLMVRPCLRSLARRRATAASLAVFGLGCSFADLGCENVSAPLMPAVPDLRPIGTLLTSPPSASVSADPVATFALGTLVGAAMGFLSLFVVFTSFLRNLQTDELDGAKWGSFGGLVMPSFFFQGASDIYNNVRRGADEARRTFQDTGRFEDIYVGIEEAQKEQADWVKNQTPQKLLIPKPHVA